MVSPFRICAPAVRFCQKLNRLKTLEDDMMETSLKRCLSTVDLALLGVGGMVGSGLYVLTGTVAKDTAGPAVVISFLIAGIASLMAALCYAEFGARVPKTGSAYMFTYVSVGEIWAFLIGWNVVLEYMIGGAAVARAWSGYLDSIFNHTIKNFTETHIVHWNVPFIAHYPDLLAAGILLVATCFISFGAKVSSWLNHIFSAISMAVIVFILIFGFILAEPANWSKKEGGFAPFGISGIMAGTATCFYAFVGFDVIAASSEEAKNPQKAIPIATAVSLVLAASAYILVSMVLTLMVPWHSLNADSALSDAFYRRGYNWAGFIVAIGSICAMNTVLLSNLFSLPRIIYAMAEDGLFFQIFSRVNPVTKVPVIAIVVFGILMALLALIFDLEALVQFLSIGTLLAYTFVAASVIVLRFQPEKTSSSSTCSSGTNPEATTSESHPSAQDSGELKEYESFSDKLQLVEIQKKAKERKEPGQLKAAFEPYLKFLSNFEPGEVVAFSVLALMVCTLCLCAVLVFGNSHLDLPIWSFSMLVIIFGLGFLTSLALIWVHEPQHNTKTFQVPLVPLIPGLSILLNVFLMLKLSPMTWIRFSVWLAVGLVVYFGYGIWHSKENLRESKPRDVCARYVVLPSGSLVETVQAVQPEPQEPSRQISPSEEERGKR
ncbi:cationic amino acid transporter 4 [Lepisosteus oculatus]|uniref:Solute carrier family 7 member 4 n=1 Tax=Lepisosteus oculatus TaxID=7918 RepID=W5MNM9_LEPOC|nr:PREDICTED: cationic amino acid transporter 4 [Lepisosteus oculatus]XP_015221837.1 PREDICTED: cationic amino acid transporter 4 [Lepisosteus oculatus]XP_015221838.1 PREDICTED: cationic amino acid transporter 4 [Lepisosteus oculatus]XP_015221839.1 PREDICTED: cationic amino acid transporter 4 [Lepisosteus oculatus]XP_015221840.1 PREDICTED: cationic amino acid transporter 4 [Lepisosteus oculatus]